MTPDDLTRAVPRTDDRTRSLAGGDDTVARPEPPDADTPSGVRVLPDSLDPSATVLRPVDPSAPTLDHYQLLGELGRGGMGVVYRALDTQLKRDVAIKVLAARMVGNPSAERRFKEEALVTGQLTHTAIPPVHQLGTLPDGRQFLVMKLIKGRTLGERLKDRPDPSAGLTDHLGVLEQVSLGVGYAHSRGVIHRDLKPANVMVGAFGEVLVMDWGLAKEVRAQGAREDTAFTVGGEAAGDEGEPPDTVMRDVREAGEEYTRAGTVLGTPSYMSPEQAAGDPDAVDARADVFSLGAILCVILTGQPPYLGKTVNEVVLKAAGWETADAFRRLGHSTADPLVVDLCKRCLAKAPAHRPANGEAVAKELADIRATAADRLKKADLAEMARMTKLRDRTKWRRMQLALGAAVACVVGLVAVAWWNVAHAGSRRQTELQADADRKAGDQAELKARGDELTAREKRWWEGVEAQVRAVVDQMDAAIGALNTHSSPTEWDSTFLSAQRSQRAGQALFETFTPNEPRLAAVRSEFDAAARRLEDAARVRELVVALDELTCQAAEVEPPSARDPKLAEEFGRVFQKGGYDPDAPPERFAEWVLTHRARESVVGGLASWFTHAPDGVRDTLSQKFDAVLKHKASSDAERFLVRWADALRQPGKTGSDKLSALRRNPGIPHTPWAVGFASCELFARGGRKQASAVLTGREVFRDYRIIARCARCLALSDDANERRQAVQFAHAAASIRPTSRVAWLFLGRLVVDDTPEYAIALADVHAGLATVQVRAQFDVLRAEAHHRIGLRYGSQKDWPNAVKSAQSAANIQPDNALFRWTLAGWLLANREIPQALAEAKRAGELDPAYKDRKPGAPQPPPQ